MTPGGSAPGGDEAAVRVVLRPLASPAALALAALAGGSAVASGLELGWIPAGERMEVGLALLVFTGLPQLIACLFGFLARDSVLASGMAIQSVTWSLEGAVLLVTAPGQRSAALGTALVVACAAVLVSAGEAATGKLAVGVVVALTGVRFGLTGLHELGAGDGVGEAAGVVGLVVAPVALAVGATLAYEDLRRHPVALTGRRGPGRTALTGPLARQVDDLPREAGVRRQL